MNSDFAQKIILALIAFLLGLLSDLIRRIFQRERRRITYSVTRSPIISVSQSLPDAVLAKLPTDQTLNVSNFRIAAENTGTQSIKEANLLVVANPEAEVMHYEIATVPAREVPHPSIEKPAANEIRFTEIKLERKQSIAIDVFLKSRTEPEVNTFCSGENIQWSVGSTSEKFGLERHLLAIIRFYILAQLIPAVIAGLILLSLSFVPNLFEELNTKVLVLGGTVGQIIESLIRFYFYLRIVPHAVALIRDLVPRRATK